MKKLIDLRQLSALLAAQSKELMREPAVLFWGIVFPILMALGLGIAFTQSGNYERSIAIIEPSYGNIEENPLNKFLDTKTEKINKDNTLTYRLIIKDKKLGNTTYFFKRTDWKEATVLLKRGEISLVLENKNGNIEYNFDPANPDARLIYLNLSRLLNNQNSLAPAKDRVELLSVKGTRYIDFLIPGLIAMGLMMSSIWGLSYSMIEKRSKKLLRRMIATPMRKSHFLISLMTVRSVMNLIESVILFTFAYLVFNVTIEGSIPALLLIFISSNIAFAGIAILIASRTANTEVGNGLINAVITPMMVLSGVFFSYHHFPDWAVGFIKILPLTMLADSIRSIFIEAAGFSEIALPFFILTSVGIVCFAVGLKSFRWH